METIRRVVMVDKETEEEFLASPFPDREDYYGKFVSNTCTKGGSVHIALCPVCGKPFDYPYYSQYERYGDDDLFYVVSDGEIVLCPEWFSEHKECKTVWAGFNDDNGDMYNNPEPGNVCTNAVIWAYIEIIRTPDGEKMLDDFENDEEDDEV